MAKKIIYNRIDKDIINKLPQIVFQGKIITVSNNTEADRAVGFLLKESVLGVDTETRPAFHKGSLHIVSLLQVSTLDTCFLFRLNKIGLTPTILKLLTNVDITMVGLSWHDDLCALRRRTQFEPGNFVDIQDMTEQIGIADKSLQKIYANLFGKKISKRQRLTNWDAEVLTESQKLYAATDAWACLTLYHEINRLRKDGDYTLIVVPEHANEMVETTKQ